MKGGELNAPDVHWCSNDSRSPFDEANWQSPASADVMC